MASINPYINFGGKAKEALQFYADVFGGKAEMQLAKNGPNADKVPPEMAEMVFHGAMRAGDVLIMASDMMMDPKHPPQLTTVMSIACGCDTPEQLQQLFDKFSDGGEVVWPVRDSEWGSVYAQVVDKFGVQWMLNADKAA